MQILSVKVSELSDFVRSELFSKLSGYPITQFRAHSQAVNPKAKPEDVALILAYSEEFELLGYIGALPDTIMVNNKLQHIAWNSCWWSHPTNGKAVSMKLFAALFKAWDYKIFFSDLDKKGKNFIQLTGKYTIAEYEGCRLFYRFYTASLLSSKIKLFDNFVAKIIVGFADFWLNSVVSLLQYNQFTFLGEKDKTELHTMLPNDAMEFIRQFPKTNISQRDKQEFDWIVQNPWVITDRAAKRKYTSSYFFSHTAKSFSTYFLIVKDRKKIDAVLMFQERNGHYRLPYSFFEPDKIKEVGNIIVSHLMQRKALSFTIYQKVIADFLLAKKGYIKGIQIKRYAAFPNDFQSLSNEFTIQDGDGDAVFC